MHRVKPANNDLPVLRAHTPVPAALLSGAGEWGGKCLKPESGAKSSNICQYESATNWQDLRYAGSACAELLRSTLDDSSNSTQLSTALRQKGNGVCNRGPWNTPQECNWDGGDCCLPTCTVPSQYADDQFEAELSCTWTAEDCKDPEYNAIPASSGTDDGWILAPNPRPQWTPDMAYCYTSDDLGSPGDGVCNITLNTAEFYVDGGDCCIGTCVPQPYYQSCSSKCNCQQ